MALIEKKIIVKPEIDYDKLAKAITKTKTNNTSIDYDKLAESINKALLQSREDEKKEKANEEEQEIANWRSMFGFKELKDDAKLHQKIGVGLYNDWIALKSFIFYKKRYAQNTSMTFNFMALICSIIFLAIQLAFLAGAIALVALVYNGKIAPEFLVFEVIILFFFNMMRVIRLEIDQMKENDMINMVFSSLMAFIAALFTTLAFFKEVI